MGKALNFVVALVSSTACAYVPGCKAQTKNYPAQIQNAVIPEYPSQLTLTDLGKDFDLKSGLRSLDKIQGLTGSLCYVAPKEAAGDNSLSSSSVLQQVDIRNSTQVLHSFELPSYSTSSVSFVAFPLFGGSAQECFVRAMERGREDVAGYNIYLLNTGSRTGKLIPNNLYGDQLNLFKRFELSPLRDSYAFTTSDPYSGEDYRLVVSFFSRRIVVSTDQASATFSWSPRNTIIYPKFSGSSQPVKNFGYPDIYEDDLKGKVTLLKEAGYGPKMSPDEEHLACFVPYIEDDGSKAKLEVLPKQRDNREEQRKNRIRESTRYNSLTVNRVALSVFNLGTKETHVITRVFETLPDLFWSKSGRRLYVLEHLYRFRDATSVCQVSVYDTKTNKYQRLCTLEQKGEAKTRFVPVRIANDKFLLLYVRSAETGVNSYHVIAVNLSDGKRHDIFSFTSGNSYGNVPLIDWIDTDKRYWISKRCCAE